MDERVDTLASMLTKTAGLLAAITPDDLARPTPCADYAVAALAEHMAVWVQVFDAAVNDTSVSFDPTTERISEGWTELFERSAEAIVAGLRAKGVDRAMTMTASPLPGEFVLHMLLMEYIGHGWDLSRALGRAHPYRDEEAEVALASGHAIIQPQYRGGDMFGAEFPVAEDAPAMDRFVAFLGRDPQWSS